MTSSFNADTSGTELLEIPSTQDQPTRTSSKPVRYHGKVKQWLPCVVVVMLIGVVAMLVAVVLNLPESANIPQASNNGLTSAQSSNKTTKHKEDNYCIYHTRPEFLESIPDDIDHLCTPQSVDGGTKIDWFQCPETNLFIPAYCMCDTKAQCINSSKDRYRKHNCTKCRDSKHCPCQNNGQCETCPPRGHPNENKCICPLGTQGKYCTKINKRKCNLVFESGIFESYAMCNNSNNNICLVKYDGKTFKCDLSELSEHQRNCSDIAVEHGRNAFQVDIENPEKQKNSVVFPAKAILIVCIILTVGVLVIVLVYIWRRRNSSLQPESV
ncbi:uncharacterized protein LOC143045506 [Mytilus galloprovincialis]|uniref:uncharacterized protein LOC143045506 n=1 Tax=Mytilus galloprovincialis TaxID=29158 RepID=UPI003F7CC1E1